MVRQEVAILTQITHMEDVDGYKVAPGEGAAASRSAGRVSIASLQVSNKKSPWTSGLRGDAWDSEEC